MKVNCTQRKALLTFILINLCLSFSFGQTTRTVCSSGCNFTTIVSAVAGSSSGDTIILNVNGAWTEKNIALPEKNLTIRGLGKTTTFLQSFTSRANASGGRIFSYAVPTTAGSTIILEDMTIRYANAPIDQGGNTQAIGGVFLATGTLKGLKLICNRVKFYANETVSGNTNNSGGACIYISASGTGYTYNADVTINDCDFDDNKVGNSSGTSLSDGPCFSLAGSPARLTVNNSTFTNNNGYTRGGVVYAGANWTISFTNCLFESNTCRNGDGGAIYGRSGLSWDFNNCLFKNNSAVFVSSVNGNNGWGGAFIGKGAKFRSCTFFGNSAVKGGAVYRTNNGTDTLCLLNCTFYGNSASTSGKSLVYGTSTTGTMPMAIVNTIFTNGAGAAASEIHFLHPYANLVVNSKNYCNSITTENPSPGTTPVFDFNSGNTTLNLSSTLASNGGTLQSLALTAGSTLINAGTTTKGTTYDIPIKDQRNYSRTDGAIDVGSFEYNGVVDDATKPTISFTALGNTNNTTDRTLTATITDANGVYWYSQLTDYRPRIYFRKNGGAWYSAIGTLSSGDGINGTWTFTISNSAMGGVVANDQIQYFVVAQDVSSTPSIETSPSGGTATSVLNVTAPATPSSYLIANTVPVKLISFTVVKSGKDASISWRVGEEDNVSHYEVQRSIDGVNWEIAGKVAAVKQPAYSYTDKNLSANLYYYRLRTVDIDEKFTYSPVRQLRFDQGNSILIYPNPVTGGQFTIKLEKEAAVSLYNINGSLIWTKKLSAGQHKVQLNQATPGTYQLVCDKVSYAVVVK